MQKKKKMLFEKDRFSPYHDPSTKEQLVIKWGGRIGTVGMILMVAFLLALQECKHDPVEANKAMNNLGIPKLIDSARVKEIVHDSTLASFDTVEINIEAAQKGLFEIENQDSSTLFPLETPE